LPRDEWAIFQALSLSGDISTLSREGLLALVAELQRQVTALQEQVAQLAADNQELGAEVDRLSRQSKRQATPFSQGLAPTSPGAPAASQAKGPSPFGRPHVPRKSPNPQ
jgi:Tfp pilus assembly protein FimV